MLRWYAALPLAVILSPASAESDLGSTARQWVGKWPLMPFNVQPDPDWQKAYPVPKPTGSKDRRLFWQFPGVRTALEALLGKPRTALMIRNWRVGGQMQMLDKRWAQFGVCKPHDCGDNHADILIETVSGQLSICWTEAGKSLWFESGRPPLPVAQQECNVDRLKTRLPERGKG